MRSQLHYATACAVSAVALLVSAAPAAGDAGPHHASATIVTDTCAGCHRVHTAKAPRLLKEAQSSLCYACHGSGAPGSSEDVVNGIGYNSGPTGASTEALRGGGFEFALIDSDNPSGHDSEGVIPTLGTDEGEPVTSTHSVGSTPQTAWGFGAVSADPTNYGKQISLSCGNCHDPHGNGNYRILRTTPRGLFTKTEEDNGTAAKVAIPDTSTKVYTTSNYWLADDVNTADATGATGFASNIAAWCSTCHTRYLSTASASTPTGDAVFSYRHTSNKTSPGAGQRNCVQCHVAHGSNAIMGTKSQSVPFPNSIAGGTDSRLLRVDSRGVCKLCHEEK